MALEEVTPEAAELRPSTVNMLTGERTYHKTTEEVLEEFTTTAAIKRHLARKTPTTGRL